MTPASSILEQPTNGPGRAGALLNEELLSAV
jgi:hypothetical protein